MNNSITEPISIFWFRRDLRLYDNKGLFFALTAGNRVLPLFIFDTDILDQLDKDDARVEFIHQKIGEIQKYLQKLGKSIMVLYGKPLELFRKLKDDFTIAAVYANNDHEPYGLARDKMIEDLMRSHNIRFYTYTDHLLFEKNEVVKKSGDPYTVFTPYYNKCLVELNFRHTHHFESEKHLGNLVSLFPLSYPSLREIGFILSGKQFPSENIPDHIIENYHIHRDYPSKNGTSKAGIHLRFGTISIRRLFEKARLLSTIYTKELLWREFYAMILLHFPNVIQKAFKPTYDRIPWLNNVAEFEKWKSGNTGYPMVDAGMRQLKKTGFMHNRLRMVTASFLAKHLLIDWRWGEAWFAANLLDYELSSNNGGWQWSAGSGCDAAPYFRIFNPTEQQKKFDPDLIYIRKWLEDDPLYKNNKPMIDHGFARERCISIYKKALSG
jgi:deoxyribodipyrimidine photo-lyase